MERRPKKIDHIELLNNIKSKHARGLSQHRFDHLVYSDSVKRREPFKAEIIAQRTLDNRNTTTMHVQAEAAYDLQTTNAADEKEPKLYFPDIHEKDHEFKFVNTEKRKKLKHEGDKLKDGGSSKKLAAALPSKSPQLLSTKQNDMSRAVSDKFTVNQKLSKFFMRSGQQMVYGVAPYYTSAMEAHNQVL